MNAFVRTLVNGMAAAFLVLLVGGLLTLAMLKSRGLLSPEKLREQLLTAEERAYLKTMRERPPEPSEAEQHGVKPEAAASDREILDRLAEMVKADQASVLVEQLRRQKTAQDERERYLEQRAAEIELAKADLQRLRRQIEAGQQEARDQAQRQQQEQARWAETQAGVLSRLQVLGEAERARTRDQAKLFELMKEDDAWASMKEKESKEIARLLLLMTPKKAAKVLAVAVRDPKSDRSLLESVHTAMLRVDLDGKTQDHQQLLARVYGVMDPNQVLPYLRGAAAAEVADLLAAMTDDKRRLALLSAIRGEDPRRAQEVERLLADRSTTAAR